MKERSQRRTAANEYEGTQTILRKVHSLDSVNINSDLHSSSQHWSPYNVTYSCSSPTNAKILASKFSSSERSNPRIFTTSKPCSTINNERFLRAPSSSSLLGATTENASVELGANIFSRGIIVGYFSVICLFIVTLKVHHDKSTSHQIHGATHSSSQKLGAAALGSLTSVLSPVLPFTGGTDLRRVGEYSLAELLPTGTFDTWDSVYLWGKDLVAKTIPTNDTRQNALHSLENIISSVPRGGNQLTKATKERLASRKQIESKKLVISASDPFLHVDEIGKLTLSDLGVLFSYAINANREGFDETAFKSKLSPHVINAIREMAVACTKSRGEGVLPASTTLNTGEDHVFGNIDALQFSAISRIFAEWRLLRQVPEGYKGYAVGMGLGHKDVVQNLVKVETAIFAWIEETKERIRLERSQPKEIPSSEDNENITISPVDEKINLVPRSPTLLELLQDEIDFDVHNGKLPRLKDKSAGMGLLWVRRQLHYQTAIFANVRSKKYTDVPSAVGAAYKEIYDKYHGWAVQKIFNYSFKAAPLAEEIYKVMDPEYLAEVKENVANTLYEDTDDMDEFTVSTEVTTDEIDSIADNVSVPNNALALQVSNEEERGIILRQNPFERLGHFILSEWEKLNQHIEREIEKFLRHIEIQWGKSVASSLCLFRIKVDGKSCGKTSNKDSKTNILSETNIKEGKKVINNEMFEKYVNDRMTVNAHKQMGTYLEVVTPLLKDLDELFEKLNMDDPTKV